MNLLGLPDTNTIDKKCDNFNKRLFQSTNNFMSSDRIHQTTLISLYLTEKRDKVDARIKSIRSI